MRGDAFEAGKPLLEAADVGVDVLDVIAAVGAFARTRIERDVQEAGILGKGPWAARPSLTSSASGASTGIRTRVNVAPSRSGIT